MTYAKLRFTTTLATSCLLCMFGCTPAKAPSAVDVATLAVAAVDQALAIAIEVAPADAGPANAVWETRVQTLEKAAAMLRQPAMHAQCYRALVHRSVRTDSGIRGSFGCYRFDVSRHNNQWVTDPQSQHDTSACHVDYCGHGFTFNLNQNHNTI
jgi:hypothetical protein